ncbi:hypothetical protein ABOC32_23095 [Pseudomonas sp. WOUb67]|uniref:hypothetical protein n=1 Tax=Pseudomonas sp. WOUb67 TaxID=3161136 RepID=UPI003CF4EEBB
MPATRLPRSTTLPCDIARTFANRPRLFEAAASLLLEQWPAYGLDTALDAVELQLASFGPVPGVVYLRPLYQVLVERFCLRTTLNLTPGQDVVCRELDNEPEQVVPVDLRQLEALLNDCGPLLLDKLSAALVDFWCAADASGETPWSWLANHLQSQFRTAVAQISPDHVLSAAQPTLQALANGCAGHDDLIKLCSDHGITLQTVVSNFSADWQLDPNLASALLIEGGETPDRTPFTALFTPEGRLLSFTSRSRFLEAVSEHWPAILAKSPPTVKLGTPDRQLFQGQAANLLQQQLEGIEIAATAFHAQGSAQHLANALDHLTSLAHLCSREDDASHSQLIDQLPAWMREGNPRALVVYSSMLADVARSSAQADGKTWLDDVPSAQAFACERLAELIRRDHPESTLDPATVQVINLQTTATAIPAGAGQVFSGGSTIPVTFSLTQLAITNLGLLRPGRVTLQASDSQPVPDWFDTTALRALITEADIGANYPQKLKAILLDDPQECSRRQRLLANQLSTQLPAQVMTSYIRHGYPSLSAIIAIENLFAPLADEHSHWVLRPLGLLRTMDASPDHPSNAWLIENDSLAHASCLLYRPLHSEPILEFKDRLALLVALSEQGDLQNDIIHRLPEEDRRIYKHGGFIEPHLFHPMEDDWAIAPGKPAPVTLSRETPTADVARAIYLACVEETLSNFREHSTSSDASRWQRWQELGWLLLNSVLPFVEGPVAEAAWLVQMETAFARLVEASENQPPADHSADWIELLVNVAFLIFNHAMKRMEQQHPLDAALPPYPHRTPTPAPVVITSPTETRLDFSWAQPSLKLDTTQAQALAELQAHVPVDALGSPVPTGPMQGLYLHADQLWGLIEGKVFKVKLDPHSERARIVGGADGNHEGPWLMRDEVGRWTLDLSLRLRGGMPFSSRVAKLQAERKKATEALRDRVIADSKSVTERLPEIRKIHALGQRSDEPRIIRNCLEKLHVFEAFVAEHIQRLHELNAQTPISDYKAKRAGTLYHQLDCLLKIRGLLMQLYKPERAHLLDMAEQGAQAVPQDEAILGRRLGGLAALIDDLFKNAEAFGQGLEELSRLASPSLPKTVDMLDTLERRNGNSTPFYWRFMRIENSVNRIGLEKMEDNGTFWLDRTWESIELAISQRLQLNQRPQASDELKHRLLDNIRQHLTTAKGRLHVLQGLFDEAAVPPALQRLQADLSAMAAELAGELAEYPDLPQRSTVSQLSRQLPGLIETRDDGLLLGQPRADDASIVDIPGAETGSVTRSYKREQQQWIALGPQPRKATRHSPGKLKTLLSQSESRLASARKMLKLMQGSKANSYLPVDIEDILLQHRNILDDHRSAIELSLTRENQTDERVADADAALNIKAIEDLSATLAEEAVNQRGRVALLQKPRMSELQFLLAREQVQIRATGPRRLLARRAGRSDDYLEEFAISHDGSELWYAHFHYADKDVEQVAYTAGHLKTAAQRYDQGRFAKDASGHEVEVYRSPIDLAAARQYFFAI